MSERPNAITTTAATTLMGVASLSRRGAKTFDERTLVPCIPSFDDASIFYSKPCHPPDRDRSTGCSDTEPFPEVSPGCPPPHDHIVALRHRVFGSDLEIWEGRQERCPHFVEGDWPDNFNSLHVTDGGWSEKFVDSCAEPPIPHLFELTVSP
jgi:hypothetical protein